MAELRWGSTIGGYPAWHMGNLPMQYDGAQITFPVTTLVGQKVGSLNKLIISGQLDISQNLRVGIFDNSTATETAYINGSFGIDGTTNIYGGTNGDIVVGEIKATSDTSWLRINDNVDVTANIYTPKGLEADGGVSAGAYALASKEVRADVFRYQAGNYYVSPGATTSAILLGKVGIGTTSPSEYLHVSGSATSGFGIRIDNTGTGTDAHAILRFINDTSNAYLFLNGSARASDGGVSTMTLRNNAGDLRLQGSGTNGIRIMATTGRVGILNDAPNEALEVTGFARTSSGYKVGVDTVIDSSRNYTGGTGSFSGDISSSGTLTLGTSFKAGTSVSAGYYQDVSNGAYRSIVTTGNSGYYFQNNAGVSTYMYIGLLGTYAGRVGIGTTAPTESLDVVGNMRVKGSLKVFDGTTTRTVIDNVSNITGGTGSFSGNVTLSGGKYVDLSASGTEPPAIAKRSVGAKLVLWNIGSTAAHSDYAIGIDSATMWYGVDTGASHKFYEGTSERMRINTGGKVGIGTSAPDELLTVSGNVNAQQYKISGNLVIDTSSNITAGTVSGTTATFSSTGTFTGAINMNGGMNWKPATNVTMTPTANAQEWSFDFRTKGTYTGSYWQVWDDVKNTLLKVDADSGVVSAPYGFSGSLSGNATSADNATKAGGLVVTPAATRNNVANQIVTTDASGYIQTDWVNITSGEQTTNAISRVYASTSAYAGDSYIRYYTLANFSKQVRALSTLADKTADYLVSQLMRWKNYGNSHVIFDASAGTSPTGTTLPVVATGANKDSAIAWSATYPTLMGWNGTSTYGVRVDNARLADTADTLDGLDSTAFMRATNANGYYGLTSPGGDTSNWIRTTVNGIIPYQSGSASSLGTSSWQFTNIYGVNIYDNGTLLENKFVYCQDRTNQDVNTWVTNGIRGVQNDNANRPSDWGVVLSQKSADVVTQIYTDHTGKFKFRYQSGVSTTITAGWKDVFHSGTQGDPSTLSTTNKTLVGAINELFQSASDGKSSIATAITGKGVSASGSETYASLASKIDTMHIGYQKGDMVSVNNASPVNYCEQSQTVTSNLIWSLGYGGYPNAIGADDIGNIYFTQGGAVKKIDANGSLQWTYTAFNVSANDIEVDNVGNVYVGGTATDTYDTKKLNSSGVFQWQLANPAGGYTVGLTLDSTGSYVYASDSTWYVRKISASGTASWSTLASTDCAGDLALDSSGNIYACGSINVIKFNSSGVQQWVNTSNSGYSAYGITYEPNDGYLYTCNSSGYVMKISTANSLISSARPSPSSLTSIRADDHRNIFITGDDYRVRKLDSISLLQTWYYSMPNRGFDMMPIPSTGYLYAGCNDATVKKIRHEAETKWEFTGHTDWVYGVSADSYGNVYTASKDRTLRKLDRNGNQIWSFTGFTNWVRDVIVSNDEKYVYGCSDDYSVRKLDKNGVQIWTDVTHISLVRCLAVDRFDNVYSSGDDSKVIKLDTSGKVVWNVSPHIYKVFGICVDSGLNVYIGSSDSTVRKLNPWGTQLWSISHSNWVSRISTDNSYIYTSSDDKTVKKINLSGGILWTYSDHTDYTRCAKADADGNVYTCSADRTVRKLTPSGGILWTYTYTYGDTIRVDIDKYNNVYVVGCDNKVRKIVQEPDLTWTYTGHTGTVNDVAVYNTSYVFTASNDFTVKKLYSTGSAYFSYTGHGAPVKAVVCDTVGNVYSCSSDYTAKKINAGGALVWSYAGATYMYDIDIDTTNNYVYIGLYDKTVRKIDTAGVLVWSYTGHTQPIYAVCVDNANSQCIYSGGTNGDNTLRKLTPSGVLVWSKTYPMGIKRIAIDSWGSVYFSCYDGYVRKLNSDGDLLWALDYMDSNGSLTCDYAGNIYVGGSEFNFGYDYTVAKFDTSGMRVWGAKRNTSEIYGIAVDSAGNVHVGSSDTTVSKFGGDSTMNAKVMSYRVNF